MTPDPYAVGPDEPLREVVAAMWARRIGSALVVEDGAVIGIFTCVDALAILGRLLEQQDGRGLTGPSGPVQTTGYHG
jgi:acetoin utilization protein AcuB